MWDLVLTAFDGKDTTKVDGYLEQGYEPFSVIPDSYVGYIVCLRKEVNEIHRQRPEPDKGTGGKPAGMSEEEESH